MMARLVLALACNWLAARCFRLATWVEGRQRGDWQRCDMTYGDGHDAEIWT